MELQTRVRGNDQTIPQDRVPVFNVRAMKCEGAPKELLGSSEVGLFGWWTAEKEELVWSVHELQLPVDWQFHNM